MIAARGASPPDSNPAGLILLRKPVGLTSFQALGSLKRALGTKKVGHAGTLDSFASGLLVALAGSYCRLAPYVEAGEKRYRGLIAFGAETTTLDPQGEVVAEAPVPDLEDLRNALQRFFGTIRQRPPLYSAVHIGGKRAYERALAGESPEMPERSVEIRELVLESYESGRARIFVRCSRGTYIRSLARDIALACGSRAHLAELERLAVGPFRLEDACEIQDFDPGRCMRHFDPRSAEELGLVPLGLEGSAAADFAHGRRFPAERLKPLSALAFGEGTMAAVFGPAGELLGIVEGEGRDFAYRIVLSSRP